jgi:6-pyruvoyltetrahydropterin/6-carboxytetrahydropterin synthase
MYRLLKSIDVSFAHHVRGHAGACINVHGHTWKLEVALEADTLDDTGFIVDFAVLRERVLQPCHRLLDHALAVGEATYRDVEPALVELGRGLLASRGEPGAPTPGLEAPLAGARNLYPGGMKVAVFPFAPTSERLAHWLFDVAQHALADGRVRVHLARVYETLHPVESVAEYLAPR